MSKCPNRIKNSKEDLQLRPAELPWPDVFVVLLCNNNGPRTDFLFAIRNTFFCLALSISHGIVAELECHRICDNKMNKLIEFQRIR